MKNTLLLLSLLVIGISTYAQQSDRNDLRGNWTMPNGPDGGISLNFIDSIKMYFSLGSTDRLNGDYKYRIGKTNSGFVITLLPYDGIRKDTIQVSIVNLTADSFQLKSVLHLYSDGRPPESELYGSHTYILMKAKITSQG